MDRLQELVRLHRMGSGGREVARLLGMSPNTERMYRIALEAAGLLSGPVMDLPTLERLKAAVEERLPRKRITGTTRSPYPAGASGRPPDSRAAISADFSSASELCGR